MRGGRIARLGAVVALLIGSLALLGASPASAVPTAPEPTVSIYVASQSNAQLCNWGEEVARRQKLSPPTVDADAFVFLHFFAPVQFNNGDWGASRYTGDDARLSEIRQSAQRLGECWYNQPAGSGKLLKIAIGTSSDDFYDALKSGHGAAWSRMVIDANDWAATNGYNSKLSFNGGFDAEPGFAGGVQKAKNWMDGYRGVNNGWNVFYYGDAEGCPSDKNPNSACTWDQDDIIYLAWQNGQTTAFPQIYDEEPDSANPPTSVNAQQWARLSVRAYNQGHGRINFAGGLSQKQACVDKNHPPECSGAELRPKEAWRDLWDEVNCTYGPSTCVTNDELRWTTEISWRVSYPN